MANRKTGCVCTMLAILTGLLLRVGVAASDDPAPPSGDAAAIAELFERLDAALARHQWDALSDLFDREQIIHRLQSVGAVPEVTGRRQRLLNTRLDAALRTQFALIALDSGLRDTRLRTLTIDEGSRTATAFVHFRDHDDASNTLQCWLHKGDDGQWRIADFENMHLGMQFALHLLLGLPEEQYRSPLYDAAQAVSLAISAMIEEDNTTAEHLLQGLDEAVLTPRMSTLRLLLLAEIEADRGRTRHTLELCDQAETFGESMPYIDLLRAKAWCWLDDHHKSLEHINRVADTAGADAEVWYYIGHACQELGDDDAAADAFRQALASEPDWTDCLLELAAVLPAGQKQELAEHFSRINQPSEVFEHIVASLGYEEDVEAMEIIIGAYRRYQADDPDIEYYLAQVRTLQGRHEDAAELLQSAFPRAGDQLDYFVTAWIDAMIAADRVMDAYDQAPDPVNAFENIADKLIASDDAATLQALVDLHHARHPEDLWIPYYIGKVHHLRQQWDEADEAFALATQAAAEGERDEIRYWALQARVHNRYLAGEPYRAYLEIEPKKEAFDQLAMLLATDEDGPKLERLVTMRSGDDPDDPDLPVWRAEAKWLQWDYASTADILLEHKDQLIRRGEHRWRIDDRLIRSLVRTGQLPQALREAQRVHENDEDPLYLAIVHAMSGNTAAAGDAVRACLDWGYWPAELLEDSDLGPALRTSAMAELRQWLESE